jgi:hypothetical protein
VSSNGGGKMRKIFVASVICLTALAMPAPILVSIARADILCQVESFSTLKARPGPDCPEGEKKIDPATLGLVNPAGPASPMGVDGAVGPKGADGAAGPPGPEGAVGPKGADGAVGPPGPEGLVGPKGADGAAGPTGAEGPVGPKGADGAVGLQGPEGPVGPKGADGAVGPPGPEGPVGPKGADGAVGPPGPEGPMGPKGADGAVGPPGTTGGTAIYACTCFPRGVLLTADPTSPDSTCRRKCPQGAGHCPPVECKLLGHLGP